MATYSKRLSDERLAEIRERADKATKGPWEFSDGKSKRCDAFNRNYLRGGDSAIVIDAVDISYDYTDSENFLVIEPEDQAFIAHARQDIPDLLAEIERLKLVIELGGK